jgi:hypothetical protein
MRFRSHTFAEGSTSAINVILNPSTLNELEDIKATSAHEGVHAGEIVRGKQTWDQLYKWEQDAF